MYDYNPPIEMIVQHAASSLRAQMEGDCIKAVIKCGFNINENELRRALAYDRGQYEKGYADAQKEYERPRAHWVGHLENDAWVMPGEWRCSRCGEIAKKKFPFCHCGAKMDEEDGDAVEAWNRRPDGET